MKATVVIPSRGGARRLPVLLVGDRLQPLHDIVVVVALVDREMDHQTRRRGTVPVVLVGFEEHAVAGADVPGQALP